MRNKIKSFASGNMSLMLVAFSNFFNNIVAIIAGLIVARILLPEELGAFNAFSIFTSYIILAQVGIPSGLSRELSYYFGKNDPEQAYNFASTSKYFLLLISVFVFFFCVLASTYFLISQNYIFALGALVIGVTSFQGIYVAKYLKILYRSENHFLKLSRINLINSLINLISLVFVYQYAFYGLCIRAVFIVIVDWYFTNKWKPIDVKANFNWDIFKELSRVGMPSYFVSNIYSLWPTFQRTFVLSFLGVKGLGIYSLALIVQNMLNTFNATISSMSFPLMSRAYGEGKKMKDIMLIPFKPFLISLFIYALFLIIGWPILPHIVNMLLPNYVEGVEAAQWMFVVALISAFGVFSNIFMVIKKNHHRLVGFTLGLLAWFFYINMHSINGLGDLVVFSKAVIVGLIIISLSDFIFYLTYLKRESRINHAKS